MDGKRVIAICQLGGEFESDKEGLLSYKGGEAHAMEIDDQMKYEDFKAEVAEMFNSCVNNMSIKYFLPGNKKTLITISNEKDLKRMIQFHCASESAEIYVMSEEPIAPSVSIMPGSRSSHTTLSESCVPVDAPRSVTEDVDDPNHPVLLLDDDAFDIVGDTSTTADPPEIEIEKGLQKSIAEIFQNEDVYHGYCVRYLSEQLLRDLKEQFSHEVKRLLVDDLYKAAYAPKRDIFQMCVERIKSISVDAYNWVFQSDPIHWSNAFFPGARYNHIASNFGELFYNWVADAHELPITQMVDAIRGKIMDLIYTRRAESNQWMTRLTPFMEEKLEKESIKAHSLQVMMSTHSYRLTYSESVHPIPCPDNNSLTHKNIASQTVVTVTPPPTRRPPGRPTTKNCGPNERRQVQCSRCKGIGHNKSSCKEGVV
ncbi:hypothetical protein DM860_007761 [Cuscuta australis]|uniref:PB1 domain-containing protein n=1 Tax=Cuscuta australis TaxID=267555 RepID=A0A328DWH6_9ASTE|nr:hypothetical protein DM860_007761 [Cuscuta australis]